MSVYLSIHCWPQAFSHMLAINHLPPMPWNFVYPMAVATYSVIPHSEKQEPYRSTRSTCVQTVRYLSSRMRKIIDAAYQAMHSRQ